VKSIPLLFLAAGVPIFSQSPVFDAASIKVSKPGAERSGWHSRTGYIVMENQSLRRLVAIAYGFHDEQRAVGGPKWADSDRFDIEARAAGAAQQPELLLMLQNLLAERFHLAVHRETRSGPVLALAAIRSGIKIQPDETEGKERWNSNRGRLVAERIPMAGLAESLARVLGTPVIDLTGAKGLYSFTLEWTPDSPNRSGADGSPVTASPGPSLDEVLASQLGLKLESKKLPIDVVVIEKAEKPTEN
jgi:uncharacterized protein (TIGR03435 family)